MIDGSTIFKEIIIYEDWRRRQSDEWRWRAMCFVLHQIVATISPQATIDMAVRINVWAYVPEYSPVRLCRHIQAKTCGIIWMTVISQWTIAQLLRWRWGGLVFIVGLFVCMHACMYLSMCKCMYVRTYVFIYVCKDVSVHVCIVWTYMYACVFM